MAAAIILFIYIVQMSVDKVTLYQGVDKTVEAYRIKMTDSSTFGLNSRIDKVNFGISTFSPNYMFVISDFDTDLLNREYAWICLCYIIKHTLYLMDFSVLYQLKLCKLWDFLTPLLNISMWVLWGVYGWINSGFEIHGGMYLRYRKDVINSNVASDSDPNVLLDTLTSLYDQTLEVYRKNVKWEWLWIPTGAICISHLVLWIIGVYMKRSSAYTGQALSTIGVSAQLTILHLFLKGSWIRSNWTTLYYDTRTAFRASYTINADYFEARYVYCIIYFTSWVSVIIFAIACMAIAVYIGKLHPIKCGKYVLYSLFWISSFIWVLCIDGTLYHLFIKWKVLLIVTHIICMILALNICILSLIDKNIETDAMYHKKHGDWKNWWYTIVSYNNVPNNDKDVVDEDPMKIK